MTDTINPHKAKALELAIQASGTHTPEDIVKRAAVYHSFLTGAAAAPTGAATTANKPAGDKGAAATTGKAADPKAGAPAGGKAADPKAGAGTKPAGDKAAPAAGKPNGAAAGAKPAGDKAAAPAGKGAPSATSIPADTKAPGGKNTYADVVAMLHKVQNSPAGRPECFKILLEDGGSAKSVRDLKPAFYDAVVEACNNVLADEGTSTDGGGSEADPLGDLGDVAGGGEQPDMGV